MGLLELSPFALTWVSINVTKLPLSATPYSIIPSALTDRLWSLIRSSFIIYIFRKKEHLLIDSSSSHY